MILIIVILFLSVTIRTNIHFSLNSIPNVYESTWCLEGREKTLLLKTSRGWINFSRNQKIGSYDKDGIFRQFSGGLIQSPDMQTIFFNGMWISEDCGTSVQKLSNGFRSIKFHPVFKNTLLAKHVPPYSPSPWGQNTTHSLFYSEDLGRSWSLLTQEVNGNFDW